MPYPTENVTLYVVQPLTNWVNAHGDDVQANSLGDEWTTDCGLRDYWKKLKR